MKVWFFAFFAMALGSACATAPQSYSGLVPAPKEDVYACAVQQMNDLGYTIQEGNQETGFIRAEKHTSGLAVAILGSNLYDQLTVSVFDDASTGDTKMRITVGQIEERSSGDYAGSRRPIAPSKNGVADGQAILGACGAGNIAMETPRKSR